LAPPKKLVTISKIASKNNCRDFKEDGVVLYRTNERTGYYFATINI
jgi:hypothetical protein